MKQSVKTKAETYAAAHLRANLAEQAAERARADATGLRDEMTKARILPLPGSRWRRHSAFRAAYERDYLWTFLVWAWAEDGRQLAVIQTVIDTKPHTIAVDMRSFLVEYVPTKAKGKRGAK